MSVFCFFKLIVRFLQEGITHDISYPWWLVWDSLQWSGVLWQVSLTYTQTATIQDVLSTLYCHRAIFNGASIMLLLATCTVRLQHQQTEMLESLRYTNNINWLRKLFSTLNDKEQFLAGKKSGSKQYHSQLRMKKTPSKKWEDCLQDRPKSIFAMVRGVRWGSWRFQKCLLRPACQVQNHHVISDGCVAAWSDNRYFRIEDKLPFFSSYSCQL